MTTKDLTIAATAIALILEQEGLSHADWPGGASGVTIGRGYDLGYHTVEELMQDWGGKLPVAVVDRLRRCCGIKGGAARELAKTLVGIRIPEHVADEVFMTVDVPRWIQRAAETFPGYDLLPDEMQGVLVSLVFNRGTRMRDVNPSTEDRREMRAIRKAILQWAAQPDPETRKKLFPKLREIVAIELRSMKRLWEGQGLGGLLKRREAEARLAGVAVLR
jgi:GH24 family phage-related lysozyme (muramidase)